MTPQDLFNAVSPWNRIQTILADWLESEDQLEEEYRMSREEVV